MKDFFISYTQADRAWAEWIAWQLEEAGYLVEIQAWDFPAGSNFVLEMHKAATAATHTIAVLSPDYLTSLFTQPEWAAAFVQDPTGEKGRLLPVRVRSCEITGLLKMVVYIDLVGISEVEARHTLLDGVKPERRNPKTAPEFPLAAGRAVPEKPNYPGSLPAIWNISFHRNPNFTGREQLLTDLRVALTKEKTAALTQPQAIHGLGGVGKTQLALEYAYSFAAEYGLVWWLRAEETVTLATDYAGLAAPLHLPEKDAQDQAAIIRAVRQWLDHNTGWLLVFDNAQQARGLLSYLPHSGSGHVIITSRNPLWDGVASPLKVEVWPRAESIAFLLRRSGTKDEKAADAVAEALGDLPLALEQAGAYVKATGSSLAHYLVLFREYRQALLKNHQPLTYEATVGTTWEISFDKLKAEVPESVDLLSALALLAPEGIPRGLLVEGREYLPKTLAQSLAQPLGMDHAIAGLVRYSLIEATNETLSLHRLVQLVTRDRMPAQAKKAWVTAVAKLMGEAFPFESNDVRFWPACEALLTHALAVAEHAQEYGVAPAQVSLLLNQTGLYLKSRAQYAQAEPLFRRALEIREKIYGPDHPGVATVLNNLAELLRDQGQYAQAEPLYRRALKIREKAYGPDHPDVATVLNNLAGLLRAQGQHAQAEPLLRRALEIDEKAYGPDHPDVATVLENLSVLYGEMGQKTRAQDCASRASRIRAISR
jgi:tetratricopeptide (TPR) repeat protein